MNLLALYNFRIPGHSMALTRIALAACMLSSKKHADNISKLICKSDFDKLKSKDSTKKLDEILNTMWAETQKHDKQLAFKCFGTACVRMVLHLLGKEKMAKQGAFESFQEIVEKFEEELSAGMVAPHAVPSAPSAGSSQGVRNLVNCSSKDIALVHNSHIKVGDRHLCLKQFCVSANVSIVLMEMYKSTYKIETHIYFDPLPHCQVHPC